MCPLHDITMGFAPLVGYPVKQADAVMLSYPLGLQMSPEIRRNDLEIYEPVTDVHGPAMTWVRDGVQYTRHGVDVVVTAAFSALRACLRSAGWSWGRPRRLRSYLKGASETSKDHFRYIF